MMMTYPTLKEVKSAERIDICRWWRHLNSPGLNAMDKPEFDKVFKEEGIVMDEIIKRFRELDGFTPEISKEIGWDYQQ